MIVTRTKNVVKQKTEKIPSFFGAADFDPGNGALRICVVPVRHSAPRLIPSILNSRNPRNLGQTSAIDIISFAGNLCELTVSWSDLSDVVEISEIWSRHPLDESVKLW